MVNPTNGTKRTKTLSWSDTAETALRAQVASRQGEVWTESATVLAALRAALANPTTLDPARPAA